MNRFARYVLRLHLVPLLVAFGVITVLFALDFLFEYVDLLVTKGIPLGAVARLFLLGQGWMLALSVPCSVLVAVLMTFGRLSQDQEIAALRTSGVSLLSVVWPLILASTLIAVGLTLFNNHVLPESNHQFANLMYDIGQKRPTFKIQEGVFPDDFEGYRLLVGKVKSGTDELQNVIVYQLHPDRLPTTVLARTGTLAFDPARDEVTLTLRDGEIHELPKDARDRDRYRRLFFRRHTIHISGIGQMLGHTDRTTRSDREMSTRMMQAALHGLDRERDLLLSRARPVLVRYGFHSLGDAAWVLDGAGLRRPGILTGLLGLFQGWSHPHRTPSGIALQPEDQSTLQAYLMQVRALDDQRWSYGVEIQKKFSIPAACVVFVLVGVPLGLRVRRAGPSVAFASLLFFLFYYVMLVGGEELAKRGLMTPFLSMWLPNLLLGTVGLWLTLRECEVIPR